MAAPGEVAFTWIDLKALARSCISLEDVACLNRSKKVLIHGNNEWENMRSLKDPEVARLTQQTSEKISRGAFKKQLRDGMNKEEQVRLRESKTFAPPAPPKCGACNIVFEASAHNVGHGSAHRRSRSQEVIAPLDRFSSSHISAWRVLRGNTEALAAPPLNRWLFGLVQRLAVSSEV